MQVTYRLCVVDPLGDLRAPSGSESSTSSEAEDTVAEDMVADTKLRFSVLFWV